jgi:hypothetical protein
VKKLLGSVDWAKNMKKSLESARIEIGQMATNENFRQNHNFYFTSMLNKGGNKISPILDE